jgi:pimeloyl-ACP methyl ester carboxylesterase
VLISATGVGHYPAAHQGMGVRRAAEALLRAPFVGSSLFRLLTRRRTIDGFLDGTVVDPTSLPERYRAYAVATARQPGADRAPLAFICGLLDAPEAPAAYVRLAVPTLFLYGDHPRFSDPDAMEALAEGKPELRFERLTGSGDLPQWERPELTIGLIREFLDDGERLQQEGSSPAAVRTTEGGDG